jgi:hypothetical protein
MSSCRFDVVLATSGDDDDDLDDASSVISFGSGSSSTIRGALFFGTGTTATDEKVLLASVSVYLKAPGP